MAHGKETPRQKMIGMMYLVLTALLALNVSKEAVEAFKLIDESLNKTIANFNVKNNLTYEEFDRAAAEFPVKAGPWRNLAYEVRDRSNEVFNLIQDLKLEIVSTAEKGNEEVIEGNVIHTREIKKIDENNIPSEILIGSDNNGKAYALKAAIEEFRDFLINDAIQGNSPTAEESVMNSLNTDEYREKDGEVSDWEYHNFHTLPLVAVVAVLSKMQNDVKNAEAEVINYLYSQIDAGSFKFNKLDPVVIANSTYVMQGSEYNAEVFIAASDTTQKPDILVGDVDSMQTAEGIWEYRMKGEDYIKLPIDERGHGIYAVRPSSLGDEKWGGLIQMISPQGGTVSYPFKAEYNVAVPNVVVSPIAMNVFYVGVQNPVDISVPGVGSDQISATMSNGRIRRGTTPRFGGSWIAEPTTPGRDALVTVSANMSGSRRTFAPVKFRVKTVPDPVAKLARKKSGEISLGELKVQAALFAEIEEFDFDLEFRVTGFRITIIDRGYAIDRDANSHIITAEQKALFDRLRRGDQVTITNITAVGPDGRTRNIPSMVFKIN